MNIELYALPVNDVTQIDRAAMDLLHAQREGERLTAEQEDWLAFSDQVLYNSANNIPQGTK